MARVSEKTGKSFFATRNSAKHSSSCNFRRNLRFGPVVAGGLAVAPSEGFGLGLGGMSFTVGKMLPKTLVGRRK